MLLLELFTDMVWPGGKYQIKLRQLDRRRGQAGSGRLVADHVSRAGVVAVVVAGGRQDGTAQTCRPDQS